MKSEEAKLRIKELIDKYTQLAEEKRIGGYNEELTKKDFILPLFEALGWNVYNNPNKTDSVSAEERISKKRVDYGFKINGIPKFFLEAKAIPVDLNKTKFAEQAINYSWHKGCTWAVLTDFEGIKVFNAEWKSKTVRDNLFLNLIWSDYLDRFDTLGLLSKESFEKGLLDKEAELFGKKSKKIPVDKQLLADFTRFREMLSKDITKLNQDKGLTEEELDESVQRVLDRLIFIRNCEDRELEARELMPALREWESVGKKGQLLKLLRAVFNYFNDQYNSKLFQEHLCDTLDISDIVLNEVVNGLYQTKDKAVYYDFSAIEADVLGNIYEQYLGHILRKTAKRAKVTESHARRKEHGIYYTPPYIVDYIVRNTLGELLKRKRPKEVEKIRVLDPACGSGSFLIKSFDILNEYWREKDKNYAQAQLDTTGQGTTFTRKVKILQNNIFGVDLDKQAVEIAQLNLLLKIAEKGHRLPLLQQNIKIGNSLIDDEEIAGDKAFKWEEEFKEIMDEGGFDVVIGNPPWGAKVENRAKEYYLSHYKSVNREIESHILFIELGLELVKEGGLIGFIVPNTWMYLFSTEPLRGKILSECGIVSIVELTKYIFADAPDIVPVIVILKKSVSNKSNKNIIKTASFSDKTSLSYGLFSNIEYKKIEQKHLDTNMSKIFNLNLTPETKKLLEKIRANSKELSELVKINYGIKTGNNEKYVLNSKLNTNFKKCLKTKEIGRYWIDWKHLWLDYGHHLAGYRKDSLEVPKIIVQYIRKLSLKRRLICAFDETGEYYPLNNYSYITGKEKVLKCVLGIINSKLMNFYFANTFIDYNIKPTYLNKLPIKFEDYTELISLVPKILLLNRRLVELKNKKTDERARIEDEIKKIDEEIDELVYALYNITEEEKTIIKESLK